MALVGVALPGTRRGAKEAYESSAKGHVQGRVQGEHVRWLVRRERRGKGETSVLEPAD